MLEHDQPYYTQRLCSDNIADLETLHTAVYGKKPPVGFFKSKYATAYTGVEHVGFIAYTLDEHLPIAYYGVIPCFIKYCKRMVLTAQSADTMTHPEHRNNGLFVQVANLTYALCRNEGIHLLFGFPNQNSVHGFLHKLNWHTTGNLNCFVVPVKGIPLEKLVAKVPVFKKLYQSYIGHVLKPLLLPHSSIQNPDMEEGFGGVYRNDDYLNYKTYSETYVIRLGKAVLWVKINHGLIIGDILVDAHDYRQTMTLIIALAKKLGLRQVIFQGSAGLPSTLLFERDYPTIPSFPVIFLDLGSGLPLDKLRFTFADIDIF